MVKTNVTKFTRSALFLLFVLLFLSAPAYAAQGTGSITLERTYNGQNADGSVWEAVHVGRYVWDDVNGKWVFSPDAAFAGIDSDFSELTKDLAKLTGAKASGVQASASAVTSGGKCVLTGLEEGLYYMCETKAAPGYEKSEGFLISLPVYQEGDAPDEYTGWDVTSYGKAAPITPVSPATGVSAVSSGWFFGIAGLIVVCAAAAVMLVRRKKKEADDAKEN